MPLNITRRKEVSAISVPELVGLPLVEEPPTSPVDTIAAGCHNSNTAENGGDNKKLNLMEKKRNLAHTYMNR
jgi:hypothetical protein